MRLKFCYFVLVLCVLKSNYASKVSNSSDPIENSCIVYFKDLSEDFSLFTQCVANYSRPFHICQNCIKYYLSLNKTRNLILDVSKSGNDPFSYLVFFLLKLT